MCGEGISLLLYWLLLCFDRPSHQNIISVRMLLKQRSMHQIVTKLMSYGERLSVVGLICIYIDTFFIKVQKTRNILIFVIKDDFSNI